MRERRVDEGAGMARVLTRMAVLCQRLSRSEGDSWMKRGDLGDNFPQSLIRRKGGVSGIRKERKSYERVPAIYHIRAMGS
jgi:hypothetical protein